MSNTTNSNSNELSKNFKDWLEKLQQESWQLELLISGFALFGIYATKSYIADINITLDYNTSGLSRAIVVSIAFLLERGWYIFFFNLVVHVIMRGLWIGAIGLRYVSNDINYSKFRYNEIFLRYLEKNVGDYDQYIEKLEKFCSIIFAYTFLLFLLLLSLILYFIQVVVIFGLNNNFEPNSNFFFLLTAIGTLYVGLGLIVFLDFITLGALKKITNSTFSKIYKWIYIYFGYSTLSVLYRPLLFNFIDNRYTKKWFYLSIPYIAIIIFGKGFLINHAMPYLPPASKLMTMGLAIDYNYYDDLRKTALSEIVENERKTNKKNLEIISLEAFEINKSISSYFVVLDNGYNKVLDYDKKTTPFFKNGLNIRWFNLDYYKKDEKSNKELVLDSIVSELYKQRRALQRTNSDNKVAQLTELNAAIDSVTSLKNNEIQAIKEKNYNNALLAYLNQIEVFIDSTNIENNSCYYTTHAHYSEKGMRCFFNTDALSTGIHTLKIKRKRVNGQNKMTQDSLMLPFVIVR